MAYKDSIDPVRWASALELMAGNAATAITRAACDKTLPSKIPCRGYSKRKVWRDAAQAKIMAHAELVSSLDNVLVALFGEPPASGKPAATGAASPSPTSPSSPAPQAGGVGGKSGTPTGTGAGTAGRPYDPKGGALGDETLADISGAARMALDRYVQETALPSNVHKLTAKVCACRACAA